ALVDLSQKNQEVIARQLKATKARFDVGDVTRTDMAQAQARLAQAQAGLVAARGALRASRATFLQITGQTPESIKKPDVALDLPESLDAAQAMAETASPAIQAARYDYRASDDDKDAVRGELLPQVAAFGSVTRAWEALEGDGTASAVGVRASMPLYEGGAVRARLRAAGHTADRRNMDLVAVRRLAQEEILTAWENLQTARAEIAARRAQVEASTLAREGVHQEADVGARTVLDALDADQEALDAQVALVVAERDEIVAQFALAAALGLLGPNFF
ncbi:MAG TPA: TolC family protein, partial [Alphaproteobacteria bacterium]|nr:TolC family protein [Alphaproteobacteria bacterium]